MLHDVTVMSIIVTLKFLLTSKRYIMYHSSMMTWNTRVKQRMKELKITQFDASKKLGIKRSTIANRLNENRSYKPQQEELEAWAELLMTTPAWLENGIDAAHDEGQNFRLAPPLSSNLPVISWMEAAEWNEISKKYSMEKASETLAYAGARIPNAYALKIDGDSMEAPYGITFLPNSYVIIDPNRMPQQGDFIVVKQPNQKEAMLRQLIIEGGERFLKALNPRYPIISLENEAIICGVAVQIIQKL